MSEENKEIVTAVRRQDGFIIQELNVSLSG